MLIFFLFLLKNGAKIRKIGIPLHIPVLLYKSGVQGGIHYTDISVMTDSRIERVMADLHTDQGGGGALDHIYIT